MKLRALLIAINTSSLTLSGILCSFSQSVHDFVSHLSKYFWPLNIAGTKPNPNRIFSFHESISLLLSIAETPLTGAGISGKSNLL